MKFRYDFINNIDLENFEKQIQNFISCRFSEITLDIYTSNYRISAEIIQSFESNHHMVELYMVEIARGIDKEIVLNKTIFPATDIRFKDLKIVQELFIDTLKCNSCFTSNDVNHWFSKLAT